MTAIALAESSGNSDSYNSSGERSQGLWQINRDAHDSWVGSRDLFDPKVNAWAAWEVSQHGATLEPWTVTHKGSDARYLQFRQQAQDAAVANGDVVTANESNLGVWTGTPGYGTDVSTGRPDDGSPPDAPPMTEPETPLGIGGNPTGGVMGTGDGQALRTFLDAAVAQTGDSYVFGHEVNPDDPNPDVFDCSELVEWAAHQSGVTVLDGTWNEYLSLQERGATVSVDQALQTPGALLFYFSSAPTPGGGRPEQAHVAISLGNGQTIEARGTSYGVGSWEANDSRFNYAAVIPEFAAAPSASDTSTGGRAELDAASSLAATSAAQTADGPEANTDADNDGLTAKLEGLLGVDPSNPDSDGDGVSDGYEVMHLKTNPLSADSDGDRVSDSVELASGTDALHADVPESAAPAANGTSTPQDGTDSDGDLLADQLERLLGTDPQKVDSDGDGYLDGWEQNSGFNPMDPASHPMFDVPTPPATLSSDGPHDAALGFDGDLSS